MVDVTRGVLAHGGGVNTLGVRHEVVLAVEGNRDGLLVDSGLERILVTSSDVDSVANLELVGRRVNGAGLIDTLVWIRILGGDALIVVDVLEGMGWQATVAAVVVEGASAVDELLLSVGLKNTVLDEMGALEAADGGEGPA